jgi:hypothetical protein
MAGRRRAAQWIVTLIMLAISVEAGFVLPRPCMERDPFAPHSTSATEETRSCCCGKAAVILKCCCDPATEAPIQPASHSEQSGIAFVWISAADLAGWTAPVSTVSHAGSPRQPLNFGATFRQPVHTRHCVWQI